MQAIKEILWSRIVFDTRAGHVRVKIQGIQTFIQAFRANQRGIFYAGWPSLLEIHQLQFG